MNGLGIDIQTINFEPVQRALESCPNELTGQIADSVTREGATLLLPAMSGYPDERPGQQYERTYRYERSVSGKTVAQGSFVSYTVAAANPPHYWVRGDGYSYDGAWMHRGRWKSLRKIIEVELRQVLQRLAERIAYFVRFKFN